MSDYNVVAFFMCFDGLPEGGPGADLDVIFELWQAKEQKQVHLQSRKSAVWIHSLQLFGEQYKYLFTQLYMQQFDYL